MKRRKRKTRVPENVFIEGEIEDDLRLWESYIIDDKEYSFDNNQLIGFSVSIPLAAMNLSGVDMQIIKNFTTQFLLRLQETYEIPGNELAKIAKKYFAVLMTDIRGRQGSSEGVIFKDTVVLLGQSSIKKGEPNVAQSIWLLILSGHVSAKVEFFERLEITAVK